MKVRTCTDLCWISQAKGSEEALGEVDHIIRHRQRLKYWIRCLPMIVYLCSCHTNLFHEIFNSRRNVEIEIHGYSCWLITRGEIRTWRRLIENELCASFLACFEHRTKHWRLLKQHFFSLICLSRFVLVSELLIEWQRGWERQRRGFEAGLVVDQPRRFGKKALRIHDEEAFWFRVFGVGSLRLLPPRDSFVGCGIATWSPSTKINTPFARPSAIASPMTSVTIPTRCAVCSLLACPVFLRHGLHPTERKKSDWPVLCLRNLHGGKVRSGLNPEIFWPTVKGLLEGVYGVEPSNLSENTKYHWMALSLYSSPQSMPRQPRRKAARPKKKSVRVPHQFPPFQMTPGPINCPPTFDSSWGLLSSVWYRHHHPPTWMKGVGGMLAGSPLFRISENTKYALNDCLRLWPGSPNPPNWGGSLFYSLALDNSFSLPTRVVLILRY